MDLIKHKNKKNQTSFLPGVSGNPNGRPKGAPNQVTLEYRKVKKLAAENYEKMFNVLLERGLNGESWAQQLYYKEFIPKKAKEDYVLVNNTDKSVSGQMRALTEALSEFEQVTHDEALDRLKALTAVTLTENLPDINDGIRETRDSLLAKVDKLEYLIDLKRNGVKEDE